VLTDYSTTPHAPCGEHRDGAMCALCNVGYTEGFDNSCKACETDETHKYVLFGISVLAIVLVVFFQYWFLLYTGRDMILAAKREAHVKSQIEAGFVVDDMDDFGEIANRRASNYTLEGAPQAKPNVTFKLKIAVGFAQIVTNLSNGLEIRWPATFKSFLTWFNIFNFDWISASGVGCIYGEFSHYSKLVVMLGTPIAVFLILYLCYYLPSRCKVMYKHANDGVAQSEQLLGHRAKFWRLILYTLFLVYPLVSSTIVRTFPCKTVLGEAYLLADFKVSCDDPIYTTWVWVATVAIFVYPVGIPVFFGYLIWSHRFRLNEVAVRARLGFLYDAYERDCWWWEIIDMLHKLFMSLLAFLPYEYQMPVAMIILASYAISMLVLQPWFRKGDDRLALLAQAEMMMFAMSGNIFNKGKELDEFTDHILTATLIGLFIFFVAFFFFTTFVALKKKWISSKYHGFLMRRLYKWARKMGITNKMWKPPSGKSSIIKKTGFFEDLDVNITRVTPQLAAKFGTNFESNMALSRNPYFLQDSNHGGMAMHDEINDEEIHPNLNPLHADLKDSHFVQQISKLTKEEEQALDEFSPMSSSQVHSVSSNQADKPSKPSKPSSRQDSTESADKKHRRKSSIQLDQLEDEDTEGYTMPDYTTAQINVNMGKAKPARKKSLN